MSTKQNVMTDPARELAELLGQLVVGEVSKRGDLYLAEKFQVAPWSQDFYRVVSTIMDRIEFVRVVFQDLDLDDDYLGEMRGHLDDIAQAFVPSAFNSEWRHYGLVRLGAQNVQPIKMISGQVRQKISYPKLSEEDLAELIAEVTELLSWLEEHQFFEQEFVRQALIDGLKHLVFRLERFNWLGWGYTLESLREVIAAYMLIERRGIDASVNPDSAAVLAKLGAVIKSVYSKIDRTKGIVETGDFILRAYGAASLIASHPTISGLLTSQ